jgi:hypothetical protein
VLFGVAARENPQISPDGARLAYLAASPAGVQGVYVKSLGAADDRLIASDPRRPVRIYRWAEDSRHLLYFQDSDGDENSHLYVVDIESRQVRDLTPFPGVKAATTLLTSPRRPHEIIVGLNLRDRRTFDAYRIDLRSGRTVLDTTNPGDVLSWTADGNFEIRAATAFDSRTGATVLRVRKSRNDRWRDLLTWPFQDGLIFGQINGGSIVAGFAPDGSLYIVSTTGHDTGRLVRIDADTGRELEIIAAHEHSDVAEDPAAPDEVRPLVMRHPHSGHIQAVGFQYLRWEWQAVDAGVRADLAAMREQGIDFPLVTSRDSADTLWIVKDVVAHAPAQFHLYDRKRKLATLLLQERPELLKYTLAPVRCRSARCAG